MRVILLVTGSTRAASTSTAALRTAAEVAASLPGMRAELVDELARLPVFNPDHDDPPPPPVAALRARLGRAHAVLFCAPEYAGTLPGAFKNLLDWTVGGAEMDRRPVAWVTVAPPGRGDGAAATLATVLSYLGTDRVEAACVRLPLAPRDVGADGLVADPGFRAGLAEALTALRDHPARADG